MRVYLKCNGCEKDECIFSGSIFESDKEIFCAPKYDHVRCKETKINWQEISEKEFEEIKAAIS